MDKSLELHAEGQLDVAVLAFIKPTFKHTGETECIACLNKGVVSQVICAAKTQAEVNRLGVLFIIRDILIITISVITLDSVFAIHVETHLRTKVDAECGRCIVLEHHGHIDVVDLM